MTVCSGRWVEMNMECLMNVCIFSQLDSLLDLEQKSAFVIEIIDYKSD